jgi:hypothetical protein
MKLTTADVRSLVIECLRKDRRYDPHRAPFQVEHLFGEIAETAKARSLLTPNGNNAWIDHRHENISLHPHLQLEVWNVVWDLIVEGVVRPGGDERQMSLPAIHVTPHGREALKGTATPFDPDGYMNEIRTKIPNADPIIVRYVAESAETLRRNCLLSSTVTLGCASEKAFLMVVDAYSDALNPTDQAKFDADIRKARTIKQQHAAFKNWYDNKLRAQLKTGKADNDWLTALDDCLLFVFSYFRDVRNDAGHPTGAAFGRERVHSHLVIFPYYLRVFYDLIEWLGVNKPL